MSERRWTVVVADKVASSGLEPLLSDDRFEVVVTAGEPDGALTEALARAHGLVVRSATKVTRELLELAPDLRIVGRAGVGVDNVDIPAATERGIAVMNAPAGNTVSAAELTMALILATARKIPAADASVRAGEWTRGRFGGSELRGKVLGLVGAGRIGGEVARRARAFGMKVVAHDPWLTEERAEELRAERVELEDLFLRSDVVSLHVPLTEKTRGLVGPAELAMLKPSAYVVNVARGGVVDEDALADALEKGELAGAALDVYEDEPLPGGSRLRGAPNLVLTPHLGASTAEAQELVALEIAEGIRAALAEGDLSRALNAPSVGGEALRRLRPLFDLARTLGRVGAALSPGGTEGIEVRYHGEAEDALKPLATHTLVGLLGVILGEDQVNFVNAPHLADVRGIGVATHHLARRTDYTEFVEVVVAAEGGPVQVAGALLGDRHPRIVRIDGYQMNVTPRGSLLVLRNRDVPGVIGKVGTLLGGEGLNIAEYHQARLDRGGGDAMAAVSVDGSVSRELVRRLQDLPEVTDARVVDLD